MLRTILSTLTLIILLNPFSCKKDNPDMAPQVVKELTGTVKDGDNNPYHNILIKLFDSSTTLETRTDPAGNFSFDTQSEGAFQVTLIPPLATTFISQDTFSLTIQKDVEAMVNFTLQAPSLVPNVVTGASDIFGEIRNQGGMVPTTPSELIFARNVFDPPIGLLTPITKPTNQQVTLSEWESAQGTVNVNCSGNATTVNFALQNMIPNGTYTIWLNFLNKVKQVGDPVNFINDVVTIEPLGSGSLNVVQATSDGSINTSISHSSCILTREVALVMIIDYHINGNTFGDAHIPDEEDVNHMLIYFQ